MDKEIERSSLSKKRKFDRAYFDKLYIAHCHSSHVSRNRTLQHGTTLSLSHPLNLLRGMR